ncbi:MAG: hypothetical protein ACLFP2_00075 [Candidatus Woesearchaeota archaeon]
MEYQRIVDLKYPKDRMIVVDLESKEELDKIESDKRFVIRVELLMDGTYQDYYYVFLDTFVYRYRTPLHEHLRG